MICYHTGSSLTHALFSSEKWKYNKYTVAVISTAVNTQWNRETYFYVSNEEFALVQSYRTQTSLGTETHLVLHACNIPETN